MNQISVRETTNLRNGAIEVALTDDGERVSIEIEVFSDMPNPGKRGEWENGAIACDLLSLMALIANLQEALDRIVSGPIKAVPPSKQESQPGDRDYGRSDQNTGQVLRYIGDGNWIDIGEGNA